MGTFLSVRVCVCVRVPVCPNSSGCLPYKFGDAFMNFSSVNELPPEESSNARTVSTKFPELQENCPLQWDLYFTVAKQVLKYSRSMDIDPMKKSTQSCCCYCPRFFCPRCCCPCCCCSSAAAAVHAATFLRCTHQLTKWRSTKLNRHCLLLIGGALYSILAVLLGYLSWRHRRVEDVSKCPYIIYACYRWHRTWRISPIHIGWN